MNKKGFTLIEVIGVVTVLALMLLVTVPSLTKTLKNNEQKKYDSYISNLKIAAENYVVEQLKTGQFFEEGKHYNYISLGDLVDAGYVKNSVINPSVEKELARDTRIKVAKQTDGTFEYDIQEYYNNSSDYNQNNLIIHYDSVEYSSDNKFKSLTNEIDYDYSNAANWTENGVLFDKTKTNVSKGKKSLNGNYSTSSITVSFSLKSLDEFGNGGGDYTYPFRLYYNNEQTYLGFRREVGLFYQNISSSEKYNTIFNPYLTNPFILQSNTNYTITYVQDGFTTRKMYINGNLVQEFTNLNIKALINYNYVSIAPLLYNIAMNNVLVYNRVLSEQEVKELYELDMERFGE